MFVIDRTRERSGSRMEEERDDEDVCDEKCDGDGEGVSRSCCCCFDTLDIEEGET